MESATIKGLATRLYFWTRREREDSMGRRRRSMPRRYETQGAARTALERIYSGSRMIIMK